MSEKKDLVITLEKAVDAIIAKGQIAINTDSANPQSDFYV